jgi:acylphosphatase
MVHRRLRLYGRVQGVCFRDWAVSAARALGLRGWVRNRLDGSVEILVAGEEAAVATFAASCRHGPAGARVDRVEEGEEVAPAPPLPAFTRRPTV